MASAVEEIEVLQEELAEINKVRDGINDQLELATKQGKRMEIVATVFQKEINFLQKNGGEQTVLAGIVPDTEPSGD